MSPWHLPCPPTGESRWLAAWCAAQQPVEPDNRLPRFPWQRITLRQVLRLGCGGDTWRVRLSNRFGDAPLHVLAAAAAPALEPGTSAIETERNRPLRFGGAPTLHLPPGEDACSDPFELTLAAGQDLALSMLFTRLPGEQTGHPGSRTTSFAAAGDQVLRPWLDGTEPVEHWYAVCDVEVLLAPGRSDAALVAIGDSITDGRGSTTDGNDRWTDALRERWAAVPAMPVVLNAALGGNRLLHDRIGPSLRSRFERDVLQRAGVAAALVHIGINDLGTRRENHPDTAEGREALFQALTTAWSELAVQARARGVALLAGTLTPFLGHAGYQPGADDEALRLRLNAWIRSHAGFVAVADFDAALRDPADPGRVRAGLHCGDFLHPSPAGMRALAAAVPAPSLRPG